MKPEESRPIRLAEYSALRDEITTFLSLQVQFMNWSVVLGGAIAGLFIENRSFELVALFPLPFLIFGFLYLDAKARVLRAAKYIQNELRPTLIDPADEALSLRWELFIREKYVFKNGLSVGEKSRWVLFLMPSVLSMIIWLWLTRNVLQPQHWLLVGFLFPVELIGIIFFLLIALKLEHYDKKLCEKEK